MIGNVPETAQLIVRRNGYRVVIARQQTGVSERRHCDD
jgi:hypothetical protein